MRQVTLPLQMLDHEGQRVPIGFWQFCDGTFQAPDDLVRMSCLYGIGELWPHIRRDEFVLQ